MAIVRLKLHSRFNTRPFLVEVCVKSAFRFQPLIIFAHGVNGFKDWGPFPAMAQRFADAGFAFCSFNFSHNGTTLDRPTDFEDLEAYRTNTVSIELSDLEQVLQFFTGGKSASEGALVDKRRIGLMGHSRGGSVSLLAAAKNPTVKSLVTLSAPAGFDRRWPEAQMEEWETEGVRHVPNSRTGQLMPLGYGLVEDLAQNAHRLDVIQAASSMQRPWLLVHGEQDETVPVSDALELSMAQPAAKTMLLHDEGHTYGARHPFTGSMPSGFAQVTEAAVRFFKETL